MGGGGGGGGGRRGRGSSIGGGGVPQKRGGTDACERLHFETALMSPQPATSTLSVGDVLELRLGQQQNRPIVEVINGSGVLLGTITSAHVTTLIECMQRGHRFVADVIRMLSGTCRVTVHHQ